MSNTYSIRIFPKPFSQPLIYLDPAIWLFIGAYKLVWSPNSSEFSFWIALAFLGIGLFRLFTQIKSFSFNQAGIVIKGLILPGKIGTSFFPWESIKNIEILKSNQNKKEKRLVITTQENQFSWHFPANGIQTVQVTEFLNEKMGRKENSF